MTSVQQNLTRARVYISGIVQGVGFRMSTVQQARQIGVNGWVRNMPTGQVEAVFEGDPSAVERIIEWCHHGPRSASVRDVKVEYTEPRGESSFEVRR